MHWHFLTSLPGTSLSSVSLSSSRLSGCAEALWSCRSVRASLDCSWTAWRSPSRWAQSTCTGLNGRWLWIWPLVQHGRPKDSRVEISDDSRSCCSNPHTQASIFLLPSLQFSTRLATDCGTVLRWPTRWTSIRLRARRTGPVWLLLCPARRGALRGFAPRGPCIDWYPTCRLLSSRLA